MSEERQTSQEDEHKTFAMVYTAGRYSLVIRYGLKRNDVIIGIDGELLFEEFDVVENRLREALKQISIENAKPSSETHYVQLSIWRRGVIFDILLDAPLREPLEPVQPEEIPNILEDFNNYPMPDKNDLKLFEVLRNIRRYCIIYDTTPSVIAALVPPLWLIEKRLWEPFMATILLYSFGFAMHILIGAFIYVLLSVYFSRAQVSLMRSYALYGERQMWVTLAAPNIKMAQEVCYALDPKCRFERAYALPPDQRDDEMKVARSA